MSKRDATLYRDDMSKVPYKLTSFEFEVTDQGVAVVTSATPKTLHSLTPVSRMEVR